MMRSRGLRGGCARRSRWRVLLVGIAACLPLAVPLAGRALAGPAAAAVSPKSIDLPAAPTNVVVDPKTDTIYVSAAAGYLYVIDGKTDTVSTTVDLTNPAPCGLAIDTSRDRIYSVNYGGTHATVSVFDARTKKVTAHIHAGAPSEGGLAVDSKTDRLYVAKNGSGTVSDINVKSGRIVKNIKVGTNPSCVAVDPTTDLVYVTHLAAGTEPAPPDTIISGKTNKVIGHVQTGIEPLNLAVDPTTHQVYVADYTTGIVWVLTTNKHTRKTRVTRHIHVGPGTQPLELAVDPKTHRLCVVDFNIDKLSIANGNTGHVIKRVPVGTEPVTVAINPSTNVAYVGSLGQSEVNTIPLS
jgi:YVTN family beta-propeller protein